VSVFFDGARVDAEACEGLFDGEGGVEVVVVVPGCVAVAPFCESA
jgi:hypothetical protein